MIDNLQFKETRDIAAKDLEKLYNDNGWILYTKDMNTLVKAVSQSLYVLSIWKNNELIGLIRLVGDGFTIIYILDILVLKDYQGQGIGTELMNRTMAKYKKVRQKILLTGNDPRQHNFYKKAGFNPVEDYQCTAFMRNDV